MNKKDLVALIKKRAQGLSDPPGVDMKAYRPPASASPPAPNLPPPPPPPIDSPNVPEAPEGGNPNAVVKPRNTSFTPPPDVVKMQLELINLARAVTNEIGAQSLAAPPGAKPVSAPGNQTTTDEQKEAAGRLAFSNFITEHYINQSDVPGVEYDPNPGKTDMSQKDPSKPTRLNVVMDTMSRVGSPKSEFKADGAWGPRTNAALRNAYALAFALLKMSEDFKLQPQSYSQSDLARLKELIPLHDKDISFTDKVSRSKEITKQIMGIRNLFSEVKEHILQKPAYRSYIEGTQAYATYQKSETPSPQLLQDLNKKFTNMTVTGTEGAQTKTVPITVNDLVTPQALELWQQKNLPNVSLQNILVQVKKHLDETGFNQGASS